MPRYGLLTIGSILAEKTNYDVTMLFEPYVGKIDLDLIVSEHPRYILLNGLSTTASQNEAMVSRLKKMTKEQFFVIAGGEHATMFPEQTQRYADYIVLYEGDDTVLNLLSALEEENQTKRQDQLSRIPGLIYKDFAGVWRQNKEVQRIKNIDYRYNLRLLAKAKNIKSKFSLTQLPLQTSRGCKFNCPFCSWISLFGKSGYYVRPIEDVIHDICHGMGYTGIQNFMIVDNLFAGDQVYTEELLHGIIATFKDRSLKPRFTVLCRADQYVGGDKAFSDKFLKLMQMAGVTHVSLGLESVNNSTINRMKKGSNIALYRAVAQRLHKYGLNIAATFVSGYGEDTYQDVVGIAPFAKDIGCFTIQIYSYGITPNTLDARVNSHLKIPGFPNRFLNGHAVATFPKKMLPSILHKAMFDATMLFYDKSEPQKRLIRKIYLQIWKGMELYYAALRRIETEILLPEKLYTLDRQGNYVLQEEALHMISDDDGRYQSFTKRIESIFNFFCGR